MGAKNFIQAKLHGSIIVVTWDLDPPSSESGRPTHPVGRVLEERASTVLDPNSFNYAEDWVGPQFTRAWPQGIYSAQCINTTASSTGHEYYIQITPVGNTIDLSLPIYGGQID